MERDQFAPIVLFVYNRPWHTKQTVDALLKNVLADQSNLIIFSDGFKSDSDRNEVNQVRNYIKSLNVFKSVEIIEREKNFGLSANIIDGITMVVNEYGKVIVVEDDLITSPYFLKFMNDGLLKYEENDRVISIHGYTYPTKRKLPETFFIKGADCWGWATWKNKWGLFEKDGEKQLRLLEERMLTSEFDFNNAFPYTQMLRDQVAGKNNSWAIRWYASAFLKDMFTLYPGRSLVYHNGNDGSGTNFENSSVLDVSVAYEATEIKDIQISENKYARENIEDFFKRKKAGFFLNKLNNLMTRYL